MSIARRNNSFTKSHLDLVSCRWNSCRLIFRGKNWSHWSKYRLKHELYFTLTEIEIIFVSCAFSTVHVSFVSFIRFFLLRGFIFKLKMSLRSNGDKIGCDKSSDITWHRMEYIISSIPNPLGFFRCVYFCVRPLLHI